MHISVWFEGDGTAWVSSVDGAGRLVRQVAFKQLNLRKVAERLAIRNEWRNHGHGLWRHVGVIVGPLPVWLS